MHPILRIGYLLQHLGAVETRKKMQKIVHILQVTGAPFPEEFRFHLYGPYSNDLRAELDAFAAEDLIEETQSGSAFTLKPTRKLIDLIALAREEIPEWTKLAEELNAKSPTDLEGISTLLYFHQWGFEEEDWCEKFGELKAHLADRYDEFATEAKRLLATAA